MVDVVVIGHREGLEILLEVAQAGVVGERVGDRVFPILSLIRDSGPYEERFVGPLETQSMLEVLDGVWRGPAEAHGGKLLR